jgi:hypothetical protein
MVARRWVATLALLSVAFLGAGCAKEIGGNGSPDQAVSGQGGGDDGLNGSGTAAPSTAPAPVTPSGGSGGSGGSGDSDDGETSEVCAALDKSAVDKAFGSSVRLERSQSSGCRIVAADNRSMIVAVFDALTLTEYKRGKYTNVTISGHPGVRTSADIMYVSRGTSPSSRGLLAAYYSGLGDTGTSIATVLMTQLVAKYGN